MIKLQKSGIFLAFLMIIMVFIIFFSPEIFEEKGRINAGVLFAGTYHYNLSDNLTQPSLIHLGLDNGFSIRNIDLKKFNLDFHGLHEVRPITANGKNKIVLGTYKHLDDVSKLIILDNSNLGFDNLQVEFEEEVDDKRIRAVYVEDIDHDGEKEIVIGTRPNGILKYYKFINNRWHGFQIDFVKAFIHDIIVEDTDGNGLKEIIATISKSNKYNRSLTRNFTGRIVRYEFNPYKDAWKKGIIWEYNRTKYEIHNYSANPEIPSYEITQPDSVPPNMLKSEHARYLFASDVDNDGLNEIIVNVMGTGNIEIFKYNGVDYSRKIIEDELNIHNSAITVGDIDKDGKDEIIALTLPENALILYNYNNNFWERKILMDNLITDENRKINYLSIINPADNSYAKILYAVESPTGESDGAHLYYLEKTNVWNKRHIGTTDIPIQIWGIFPAED